MRSYLSIFKARILSLFQYRLAAIAGICTQIFWGIIKVMIITAFYAQSIKSQPISLLQAITFIWLGQAFLQLLPWNIDKELEEQVRGGNVVYELARPLNLYWFWFSRSMAMRIVPTILRSIPLFLIVSLFFDFSSPISWNAAFYFFVSIIFAALLSSAITTIVIISLFWTISGEGIKRLLPSIVMIFSGMIVPLPLFPKWSQLFLDIQPFRGLIDIPCRLYTGVIPTEDAFFYLGFQFFWVLIFVFLGKYLMNKAIKRFVIQGG